MLRLLFTIGLLFLFGCQANSETTREIEMYNGVGDMVGTATLTEHPDGVEIKLKVEGLSPGFHGIHIHELPKCEGPDFKSAGNHLNPDGKEHGLLHPKGPHLGDLPNIEADGSGQVDVELMVAEATLLEGKKSLLRDEGTSLIITEGQDDGMSQPSGNSGARLICGEIKRKAGDKSTESPTDPTESDREQKEE